MWKLAVCKSMLIWWNVEIWMNLKSPLVCILEFVGITIVLDWAPWSVDFVMGTDINYITLIKITCIIHDFCNFM
jgi:hypothetical protein